MARVIVIRITVDNREAINAVKLQTAEQKKLNEQIAANAKESRNAESHAARMAKTTQELSHVQQGLTNSFIKGNIAARAISATYLTVRDSVRFAIGESAKFELTMARVSAVTGSSRAQTAALAETVFMLSRNVAAGTNEISNTALELAKLGFSGENLKAVLGGVAQLSTTLGDSLEATGQLVGGVVNAFNLSSEEATKVADKLFIATGRSATNIEGFKVAFSLASAVAEDAGIKFEEFAAAVAALSNQGIRASTIGTGLRNFIAELSKEGSKAQQALGGSIEELGLLGAMEKLSELKLKPGALIELFGKPGSPVASGLQNAKTQYLDFLDQIKNSDGALVKAGATINETLVASVTQLKNAFLEFFTIFSSQPAQLFKDFIGNITEGIQRNADEAKKLTAFNSFIKQSNEDGVDPKDILRLRGVKVPGGLLSDSELQALFEQGELLRKSRDLRGNASFDEEFGKFGHASTGAAPEAIAEKARASVVTAEQLLAQFEKITLEFETFQAFGGEFDFDNTTASLDKLSNSLRKMGENKDAIKVLNELQSIRAYQIKLEKESADVFIGNRKIEEGLVGDDIFDMSRRGTEDKNLGEKIAREKKKLEDSRKRDADKKARDLFEKDKVKVFFKEVEDSVDSMQIKVEALTLTFNGLGDSTQLFGELLVDSFLGHGDAFSDFQDAFGNLAKQFVSDLIAMELRILAFKAALKLFSLFSGIGAPGALAPAPDLIGLNPTLAANGFDGVVNGPRLFLAGEGGEPERVKITPLSKMGSNDGGGNTYITVQGDVFDSEKLVDKIALTNERSRTRYV